MLRQLIVVGSLIGTWSCAPNSDSAAKVTEDPVTITHVSLFTDQGGKPGTEVGKFDYRQKTLHFRATLSKPLKNVKGKWIFTAKSTSAGNNQQIQSLDGVFDGADMSAEITLKKPWPVGTYQVDIVAEEAPIGNFEFEVTGEKSRIVFLGHTLATDDGKGLPGKAVQSFKPGDKTMHIQVTSKGIDTTEPEVVWRLYHLVGSKETELANTVQPRKKLQDSVLTCNFTSPKDWQPGQYRADVFIDGKKAHSIPVVVK